MRIFVSAAEISSDIHAAKILRALIDLLPPDSVRVAGIGGPRLRALPEFECLAEAESMRVMGFVEVLGSLGKLARIRDKIEGFLSSNPPDLILTFDYPDFHFSLMKRLSRHPWFAEAFKICAIPPKVWVWRKNRVERIRRLYDGVLVVFPFEEQFYRDHGIPVLYRGNPLIADLLERHPVRAGGDAGDFLQLAVLPGSRKGELKQHLPIVAATLHDLSAISGRTVIAEVPVPRGVEQSWIECELVSNSRVQYRFFPDGSGEVLSRNSVGLVKSGTSTLEAAVLGCVPVIFYRMNPVSEWIFKKFVRYAGPVGLPNILLGIRDRSRAVFREFLGREAAPGALAVELRRLLEDSGSRDELQRAGDSLRSSLVPARGPVPTELAKAILEWVSTPRNLRISRKKSTWIALASFFWSCLNGLRRGVRKALGLTGRKLPVRSILVGNLQAGGAGKTPLVIALAQGALARGDRVGVVSRGYGIKLTETVRIASHGDSASRIGDEPAEILSEVPGVKIALSADRHQAAEALIREGVNLILADDGFQNLRFRTDVTVLAVTDAGRNEIPYRDFDSVATLADFVVQTKGEVGDRFGAIFRLEWESDAIPHGPLWLWCAVGDPDEVVRFHRNRGCEIERVIVARDHAVPDPAAISAWINEARLAGAHLAVTPKDAVKIPLDLRQEIVVLSRRIRAPQLISKILDRLQ